jgi:hypothetical protein
VTHLPRGLRRALVVFPMVLTLVSGAAWGYWTTGSVPGGNGLAAATSVNQGSTPTAVASGRSVTVSWAATTMANGDPVTGYSVARYDAATMTSQPIGSGCTGTLASTTCTETRVPAGDWVYAVTPRFGANWRGVESARSSTAQVAAPKLTLSSTAVKSGDTLTGQANGFLVSDTLTYRLDSSTGTVLTGTLSGTATPTAVPASSGGSVVVTVPAGTSEGTHAIYAVTSPSGDVAHADFVVDSTAPPLPVLTLTPTAVSGDTVTFAFTESEAGATVECRMDTAAFGPCDSPIDYAGLATGSHTFQARATDAVGNISAATSYTWLVNLTVPTVSITFPTVGGMYSDSAFNVGCGTASTGDVCGSADDDVSVTAVAVSLRRISTGLWWNGTSFSATTETFLPATGTTDWSYAINPTVLAEGDFTLRVRASDGANLGYDARTFTVDRTAPATPALSSAPPATSGPSTTFVFTDTDPTAAFECRIDGGSYIACASPKTYGGLATGSHTVNVRAVDAAGNTSVATSTTWTVDATPPTTAMTFPTATTYNLAGWAAGCSTAATDDLCGTAADSGSGLADVAVSIRRVSTNSYWDGISFGASTESWRTASGTATWSYGFAGSSFPGDGSYVVRYRATDAVGNATIGSVTLTVDTTPPPAPRIDRAPSDPSSGAVQFDFSDTEAGTTFSCRMDGGSFTPCTSPTSYCGLTAGSHTFSVRATDGVGNVSTTTSYTWIVDVGLPAVSIASPTSGSFLTTASYTAGCGTPADDICGTAADPGGGVASVAVSIQRASTLLYWNGTSFSSATEVYLPAVGTTSWSFAMASAGFPADDGYTIHARVTDNVGLTSVDTVGFNLDRTAPVAPTITSGPSGTTAGNDTFAFSGESGATFQCRLDAGTYTACTNPRSLGTLADGSHTFDVRAVDRAGNVGTATSRTWTVDATGPVIGTTFPAAGARLNNTTYTAGCSTATSGDICGTTSDSPSGVAKVEISLQRASTGLYLTGTTFSAASQTWITTTGTTSWTYALTAATFPADDTYTMVVRATDTVGNVSTSSRAFVIDRTKPIAAGVTTTNASTLRKLDLGDTFTLTWNEAINPASIIAGWNGTGSQPVVVRATNANNNDKLTVYNASNTTLLPLGTLGLKRSDYVTASMTFGLTGTPSTLTMSGNSVTITLGTPNGTPTVAAAAGNMSWTPATGAADLAGNASATTAYVETDNDSDF